MSHTIFMTSLMFLSTIAMAFIAVTEYREKNRNAAWGWSCAALFSLGAFFQNLSNLLKHMS